MGGRRDRAGNSQGSWFSSGYYGHFRSKHRNDFLNQYRSQSKPSPPQKFHDMISDRPTHHHFSHHDNRFSFLNTVDSFEGSLGKRKVQTSYGGKFIPDFIAWVPHKKEIESSGPKVSIYRDTFNGAGGDSAAATDIVKTSVPQILVPSIRRPRRPSEQQHSRPVMQAPYIDQKTAAEEQEPMSTTYRLTHRHRQPDRRINTDMNTGVIVSEEPVPEQKTMEFINPKVASIHERPVPSVTRLRRTRVASAPLFRSSVADCMVWHGHRGGGDGGDEQLRMIPHQEPVRPKTVMGLLPVISNSVDVAYNNSNSLPSDSHMYTSPQTQPPPEQSSRFGITPSATSTVPMETMQMSQSSPAAPVAMETRQMSSLAQSQPAPTADMSRSFSHVQPSQPAAPPQPMLSESF